MLEEKHDNDTIDSITTKIDSTVKRQRISIEDFLQAWEGSETADEVAEKLGTKKTNVMSRASQLRTKGLPLKKLRRSNGGGRPKATLNETMQILASVRGVSIETIMAESKSAQDKKATGKQSASV